MGLGLQGPPANWPSLFRPTCQLGNTDGWTLLWPLPTGPLCQDSASADPGRNQLFLGPEARARFLSLQGALPCWPHLHSRLGPGSGIFLTFPSFIKNYLNIYLLKIIAHLLGPPARHCSDDSGHYLI